MFKFGGHIRENLEFLGPSLGKSLLREVPLSHNVYKSVVLHEEFKSNKHIIIYLRWQPFPSNVMGMTSILSSLSIRLFALMNCLSLTGIRGFLMALRQLSSLFLPLPFGWYTKEKIKFTCLTNLIKSTFYSSTKHRSSQNLQSLPLLRGMLNSGDN